MIPRLVPDAPVLPIHAEFLTELTVHGFAGEVSDQYADRLLPSTDNSIYQRLPDAVVYPRHTADVVLLARLAAQPRFSAVVLTARGGGTGTNGQSLTSGIVVDISRHMNRILDINVEERWVRVQAGVVKDQLNAALAGHGLFFAPELSTSNRATIGGMINTDASGQGSCLYGKTRDHVLTLSTVLPDGTLWESTPLDGEALDDVMRRPDRVGDIHRLLDKIHDTRQADIEACFPKLNRCLTGYDLAHIYDAHGRFDLNAILCGSEGTLGMVVEARLNVLPIPTCSALVNIRYPSFDAALRDAPALMLQQASSIETVDGLVLQLAQQDSVWHGVRAFFPDNADGTPTQGINLVECLAMDEDSLQQQLNRFTRYLAGEDGGGRTHLGYTIARGSADVGRIWGMRKKAVGLLGNASGGRRPVPFVEDTAVPPEHLADYIAEFRALLDQYGLRYGMFGHVDAGVLHVRPALDLKDPDQEVLIRQITDGVAALTHKYHGLLWGEHGKGLRSEYAPRFFGPLYPVLQQIKACFDPHHQYNPGKIATPTGKALTRLDEVPLRGQFDRQIPIAVRQQYDEALHCNGNGACYNYDQDDAMCPSWKVTRERQHSPKGRASLVREWLRLLAGQGHYPQVSLGSGWASVARVPKQVFHTLSRRLGQADFSHQVKSAMDGCLACKSCVGQCPIKVDVPTFRAKFLYHYHQRYLRPVKDYAVTALEFVVPVLAKAPSLYNLLTQSRAGQWGLRRIGLVHTPAMATVDVLALARQQGVQMASPAALRAQRSEDLARSVVIVQDAFTRFFEPQVLLDLIELIRQLGGKPWLAPLRPNGKPLHVHGFLGWFQRVASRNAAQLKALAGTGVPLVGVDPSMTLTYRSEYAKALPDEDLPAVQLVQEWLTDWLTRHPLPAAATVSAPAWLLPHCSEKTNVPQAASQWQQVFAAMGVTLQVPKTGCCGMAGTYGHESQHRATSATIYDQSWRKQVEDPSKAGQLMATGYSCRCQSQLESGASLPHPVSVLNRLLKARTTGTLA
ncbi:D-2-hydroxyglutarate dehydrogenase YdiJ [Leeia oryzae]|uniref:D-2-hydroxyglutarate dehydrogenase YdiJ n=1 Tax=Leeia oryzae TaxID=356662 RepID=UPI000380EC65|nr:FAD-binding and (Fe-S)-binding domain-containing protein [Leeia oryzae]